jgi:hypothetical protein
MTQVDRSATKSLTVLLMSLWDAMGKFNIGVKNNIFGHTTGHSVRSFILRLFAHETIKSPPVRQVRTHLLVCTRGGTIGCGHILGTLLVVDGYTGKGKNKHECTRIKGSERNSEDST